MNKDFAVPVLDSSRASRPLLVPPEKGNEGLKRISVKSKYRVRSIRLPLENFNFDFHNAPYFKMASNFVILLSL